MIPGLLVSAALEIGKELVEDKDKKSELAFQTMEKMLDSKTYRWVDGLVKLSYAAEQITKGLIRPLASVGMFVYGIANPDVLTQLHALGTVGDVGIAAMFGSAPAWGLSRHAEKKKKAPKKEPEWVEYD